MFVITQTFHAFCSNILNYLPFKTGLTLDISWIDEGHWLQKTTVTKVPGIACLHRKAVSSPCLAVWLDPAPSFPCSFPHRLYCASLEIHAVLFGLANTVSGDEITQLLCVMRNFVIVNFQPHQLYRCMLWH